MSDYETGYREAIRDVLIIVLPLAMARRTDLVVTHLTEMLARTGNKAAIYGRK